MDHLEAFITRVREEGCAFTQVFPPDCVPIRRGEVIGKMTPYVTS
jgi:peptidoglycan-N-acetylglucosamine deacetylase